MAFSDKAKQARRDRSIRDGATSRRGKAARRLSTEKLFEKARSGKATTYEAYLLSRRKSAGGKGG